MKTIEIKLYKFDELSDEAKEFAVKDNIDILTDFGSYWYEPTIQTFKDLGIDIEDFDLYSYNIAFELTQSVEQICKNIIKGMGYEWAEICQNYLNSVDAQLALEPVDQDMLEEMEALFLKDLELNILGWLDDEYRHLTDKDTIANYLSEQDYDFTEKGELH